MQIKRLPTDFLVEELLREPPGVTGAHTVYRLEKESIGTMEAIADLARTLGVPPGSVAFCGLKDKHAKTAQHVSIPDGPERAASGATWTATPAGRRDRPLETSDLAGNRFRIVLRDLERTQAERVASRARTFPGALPNYFDDQRFGSARGQSDFIGRRLALGDAEGALRLALASPSADDDRRVRERRVALEKAWEDWKACVALARDSSERRAFGHLAANPRDFAGAFDRIPRQLRALYLHAYQSYLFNRLLADEVCSALGTSPCLEFPYLCGMLAFPDPDRPGSLDALRGVRLPLLGRQPPPEGTRTERLAALLAEEGLPSGNVLRPHRKQRAFFRSSAREALVEIRGFSCVPHVPDDLHPKRRKLTLTFDLPPGCYATLVVRFLAWGFEGKRRSHPMRRGKPGAADGTITNA
ncbi:MAG: tRNA pseudouridine(13) synthase TruD [Planctomycetes bacterium]|nr:tRNA pseudouridine(13) synthase TruD [Planctomycetota bacterium]